MNIIKHLNEHDYNGMYDHHAISSDFVKRGITVSYETVDSEPGVQRTKRRYIFTNTRRNKKTQGDEMCVEANGLILEAPDWTPLVISMPTPKTNVEAAITNSFLKDKMYDIYKMEDGTIINLYYYKLSDKWIISTARGIEVNECTFNTLDYNTIVDQCLEKMSLVPQDFYNSLDKNTCYTLGFKHPDMHPFQENTKAAIYKMWFVQMTNINVENMQVTASYITPWSQIPNHTKVNFPVNSTGILFSKCKTAYNDFADNGITNYGFILVAKNPTNFAEYTDYSVVLLESSLMTLIRHLWYDSGYQKLVKEKVYNRINMILVNSFLDDKRMEPFSILFPQYRERLESMNAIETGLVNNIHHALTCEEPNKDTDAMINILCMQVTEKLTVGVHERPKQKIRDIIHSTGNMDYYYTLNTTN